MLKFSNKTSSAIKAQSKISLFYIAVRESITTGASGTCLNLRILLHDSISTHSVPRMVFLYEVLLSMSSKQAYKTAGHI